MPPNPQMQPTNAAWGPPVSLDLRQALGGSLRSFAADLQVVRALKLDA